ncbi:CAP Gly-rich domain-containing protein [Pavlovales sp. CCMP2436]|nr:CAP Gly-rich domain-containing protein [Pavlovales sp. CCMP2436]
MLDKHGTINNRATLALRQWTTMDSGGQNRGDSTVLLHVSHSNLARHFHELRLDMHITVDNLKDKLRTHTGTGSAHAYLTLLDDGGQPIADLDDESKMLGYYSPYDGCTIHITDLDPYSLAANGGLDDVSLVEKSKEMRTREHARQKKLDPNYVPPPDPVKIIIDDPDHQKAEAELVAVGMRCQVKIGKRRGEVKYVGRVEGVGKGFWIGVQYDEPVGRNNGTARGKRYFECPKGNYGAFVRPVSLAVGDFPERGLDSEPSSDEEEGEEEEDDGYEGE